MTVAFPTDGIQEIFLFSKDVNFVLVNVSYYDIEGKNSSLWKNRLSILSSKL